MYKKTIPILFAICSLIMWTDALEIKQLPKDITTSQALYVNCLQRTQTQQLLKAYLLQGLNSSYKNPEQMLKDALPLYDARFMQLDLFFRKRMKDPEHIAYLDTARKIWKQSKLILEAKPNKENAKKLYAHFRKLVKVLGKAKVLVKRGFEAISITGGLCRNPLYISNLYLMKLWGVELERYDVDMQHEFQSFNSNFAKLEAYKGNSDEIMMHIKNAEDDFRFFLFMYEHKIAIPTLISKKADTIFYEIRTIKSLYGKMLK